MKERESNSSDYNPLKAIFIVLCDKVDGKGTMHDSNVPNDK